MNRIHALLEFLDEDPSDPFTIFALAREYIKAGNLAEAQRYFERLTTEHPDYVGTYYHLGKLFEDIGQIPSALETYRKGISVSERARDYHAKSELQSALTNLELIDYD